jgi:hypothetical protein
MDWDKYLKAAKDELATKTYFEIEKDTAFKWAARAIESYKKAEPSGDLELFLNAEEYRHEAIEHAAMVNDNFETLKEIEIKIEEHRK